MKIYMRNVRQAKFCSKGARLYFNKHNLDYSDFLKNGIEESEFIKIGDNKALDCIKAAKKEMENGRQ